MKCFDFPRESDSRSARHGVRGLCVTLLVAIVSAGCGDYGGSETDTSIVANSIGADLAQGLSVTEQVTGFEQTVYPVLRQYCIGCHAAGGSGSPKIADADPAVAWSAVVDNQKVNFADPAASRLVRRLAADFHHCWSNCSTDAADMLAEILAWQAAIEVAGGTTGGVDVAELTSDILTVSDGREEVGAERFEAGMIARWE
jgi:hypothetical protein